MKKLLYLVCAAMLVTLVASCTTFKLSGLQMDIERQSYQTVGELDLKITVHEFLGNSGGSNLANVSADNMDTVIYDAIQREVSKFSGDAAVNVTVEYQASVVDILLNAITFGIYAPAEAHVTGTIIKYQ
ncbi:Bor/Iss family lipoprotein [Sediminispirochaeta bajacaliforniensis]|uniref:Bor/Iss family lipoprotein n=1 Tax=Sediminispirochaeta bajacaliforniensis TaxID=148 RepID=UPI0003608E26|nr:hypothetical protein [Sediminispirochaeta bajacaliforniensis]